MTTGMRPDQTTVVEKRGPRVHWGWIVLAAILALALVSWATTPKPQPSVSGATSGAVQDSASGQQGAVGNFREQVVPNAGLPAPVGNNPNGMGLRTPNGAKGQPARGGNQTGTDAGAGNTGINTATDAPGGAR